MQFFYAEGDQQRGPVDLSGLAAANISRETLVWREGMSEWQAAGAVPELAHLFRQSTAHTTASEAPGQRHEQAANAVGHTPPAGAAPPTIHPVTASHGSPQLAYGGYAPPPTPPAQGLSVASMVLGILSLPMNFCYGSGILLAILAVVFGHMAASQSKKQIGTSNGMATAGLVCGYISLCIALAFVVFFLFLVGAAAVSAP